MLPAAVLLLLPAPALPLPQDPGVVAWFELGGRRAPVSKDDLALELGQRFRRKSRGESAIQQLIDLALVEHAATEAELMPTPAETDAWVEALHRRAKQGGVDLADRVRQQGMSSEDFAQYARLSIAHERLVRRELGLAADQPVDGATLSLWLQEARKKIPVETDEAKLPAGVVARVAGRDLDLLELGRVLARSAPPDERLQFTQQIVWRRIVEARGRELGLEVSETEAAREVEARRRQIEARGKLRGVGFDDLLQAEGTNPRELARSPVLRAQILEQKIVRRLLPDEQLAARLRDEPESVQGRYGARRRIALIEAVAEPLPKQSAEDARADARRRIETARRRITAGEPFDKVAREISDDAPSRIAGGDTGWHFRLAGERLPPELRAAAFAQLRDEVSEPIETERGFALIRVIGIEAEPHPEVLQQRIRDAEVDRLRREWLTAAKLELVQG
jgi:parvulin-like peptidyl-prolyl isomerase